MSETGPIFIRKYLTRRSTGEFDDIGANRLLQMFLVDNIIDLLFWLWGPMARYENGDLTREEPNQPVNPSNETTHGRVNMNSQTFRSVLCGPLYLAFHGSYHS